MYTRLIALLNIHVHMIDSAYGKNKHTDSLQTYDVQQMTLTQTID